MLLIIFSLSDSELMEVSQRSPLVTVDDEAPFLFGSSLEHKRPRTAFRNLQIVQVLGFGEPNRPAHMEEVFEGVEHAFNITRLRVDFRRNADINPADVYGLHVFGNQLVRVLRRVNRLHVEVMTLEDDAEKVSTVVVEKAIVSALNPMVDSH